MIHSEEIQVFIYTKEPNLSGGFVQTDPVLKTLAPTWATIEPVSGNDTIVNTRKTTESVFDVTVNYRSDFTWDRTMFITTRFGNLDIINIQEGTRKRTVKLTGVRIEGRTGTTTGGQIMTIYKQATPGATSITFPELVGANVLLAFRDGICKWVVNETPDIPNKMRYLTGTGTFELMEGDIFGDELVTVLYRAA